MRLQTGHAAIDIVLECVVALCRDEIRSVLAARDTFLFANAARSVFEDTRLEILSCESIALDAKLDS